MNISAAPDLRGLKRLCIGCVRCCVAIEESIKRGRQQRLLLENSRQRRAEERRRVAEERKLERWRRKYRSQLARAQRNACEKVLSVELRCECKQRAHWRCLNSLDNFALLHCPCKKEHSRELKGNSLENFVFPKQGVDECAICNRMLLPGARK